MIYNFNSELKFLSRTENPASPFYIEYYDKEDYGISIDLDEFLGAYAIGRAIDKIDDIASDQSQQAIDTEYKNLVKELILKGANHAF